MDKVTRRSFVTALGVTTVAPIGSVLATGAAVRAVASAPVSAIAGSAARTAYVFFDAAEARFVEAACECLIPADACAAGALEADVPRYLDGQLGGAWGAGEIPYRNGPWQPGTYAGQFPSLTPSQFFRAALRDIDEDCSRRGCSFAALPRAAQRACLVALESGDIGLHRVSPAAFFDLLLRMTVEGFFAHPVCGLTRDRVAWRIGGFPGAHAATQPACAAYRF